MTLSNVVDDFCLAQGNMNQSAILATYRHARWSWKNLFRKTLWEVRKAVLCVDCDHTIKKPKDCERILNISVVDCHGHIHPLSFNPDLNTASIRCLKSSCSCTSCNGNDTLCAAIDTIKAETETVTINGTDYTKTTWTRCDPSGAIQKEMKIPAWDERNQTVVYNTITETICNVETTTNGCIKSTAANVNALRTFCGVGSFLDNWNALGFGWNSGQFRDLAPAPYNYWGDWNVNAADPNIIHIFGSNQTRHFNHDDHQESEWRNNIRQVILDYQTNGETPDAEILIPEYAVEAVQDGIVYRQKRLNPRTSEGDKVAAKNAADASAMDVARYLNPINLQGIREMQSNARLW